MPEHPGIPQPPAKIRESVPKHVWIKLTGPAAGSLIEAFCQSAAGLQKNVSAKVVTPREEDAAQKDDVAVPPTMIVMEGKAAGAQKYIKVEKLYRIVLLGNTEAGKSSLANTIFGENVFKVDNTECQTESKSVHGRRITLINTPNFSGPGRSEKELKPEMLSCITECTPGPHAFLIVLKVEKSTEQQQQLQAVIEKISQYFSEEVFKYAAVVFIQDGPESDEMKVKEFIGHNEYLSDLVKKCKSRYRIINKYDGQGDSSQSKVAELLNTIDQVVKENKGVCYTNKMLPQVDTWNKASSSVSKNEMIKLAGTAAESMAKTFSGSAVVVLTPGSKNGKEKDGTETDKKEENGDGKATSELTNNGQKEMTNEEEEEKEEGGRKNEEHATSEKMNDKQTEMTKEKEERKSEGEIAKETKEAQEGKTTGKSNELEQDEGPNETQEEKEEEAGKKLQEETQEKMEGKVEDKPQKKVQQSARENELLGGGASAGGGAAAGALSTAIGGGVAAGALSTAIGGGVAAGALSTVIGGGVAAGALSTVIGGGGAAGALSTAIGGGVAAGALSTAAGVPAAIESLAGATGAGASAGTAGAGGAGGAAGAVEATGAGASAGAAGSGGTAAGYVAAAAVATGAAVGVAWLIQKIRKVIEWIKQHLGVVLLVLVFYSLLLSWFFLKAPFVGTLLLSFMFLLLVVILVII